MACSEQWLEILSAWQDGEATTDEVSRVREHLPGCGRCEVTRRDLQRIRTAMKGLSQEPARSQSGRPVVTSGRRRWLPVGRGLTAGALAAAAVAALVWGARLHRPGTALVNELEARHLTAFSRATPCDFESSDPAAVKAWVAANVGYEVEVRGIPGARLLGARRCQVGGGAIASLLYRRGDEALSVFLPRAGTSAETETARLARSRSGCTVGQLGAAVCARPGRFAVAETSGTALAALEPF